MTSKHHSLEVRNAIISLWAKDSYLIIVKKINSAGTNHKYQKELFGLLLNEKGMASSIFELHPCNFEK